MGELKFMHDDAVRLEKTRTRFSDVIRRHAELTERLSRDSDKMIFDRLQREFEAARGSQTEEISLDGDQWNDGLLATIREQVHIEADRKAILGDANVLPDPHLHEKSTYRAGNKVADLSAEAASENQLSLVIKKSISGEPCEIYHCVLESKSFLEKMTVLEHTIPFFLPIREAENDLLSSNAMKFIDHVGELLQAFVDRREQVRLVKELYGSQIGELYHSLLYHMIEFAFEGAGFNVTASLRYADLVSILPTRVRVFAWPKNQTKKSSISSAAMSRPASGMVGSHPVPARLSYAEEALRTLSLPAAYADVVLNLQEALHDIFQTKASS